MDEVRLDAPRILTPVGDVVARRVPQHVGVDREADLRDLPPALAVIFLTADVVSGPLRSVVKT